MTTYHTSSQYSVNDLAAATGLHKTAINQQIRNGNICATKINAIGGNGTYVLSPQSFLKAVDDYSRLALFTGSQSYYCVKELARETGYTTDYIAYMVRKNAITATKYKRGRSTGTYLFTDEEFQNAVENLKRRKVDREKYKTIGDLVDALQSYTYTGISDLVRSGEITAELVKNGSYPTYIFDPEQYTAAIEYLGKRQRRDSHLPKRKKIEKRFAFHKKIKGAHVSYENGEIYETISLDGLSTKNELKLRIKTIQEDERAFAFLLRLYLPVIKNHASKIDGKLSLSDRISEGELALWRSIVNSHTFAYARKRTIIAIHYAILEAQKRERKLLSESTGFDFDAIPLELA